MMMSREMCAEHLPDIEICAHRCSQIIHNIVIEHIWEKLKIGFRDIAVKAFNEGITTGVYNSDDHSQKCIIH